VSHKTVNFVIASIYENRIMDYELNEIEGPLKRAICGLHIFPRAVRDGITEPKQ
jgi:hypothetical protein